MAVLDSVLHNNMNSNNTNTNTNTNTNNDLRIDRTIITCDSPSSTNATALL